MRIATWNVNSLKARLGRVERWLEMFEPDVLCLQETKLANDAFPAMTFEALGYDWFHHGEGRWNGVAILSRLGIEDPIAGFGDDHQPDTSMPVSPGRPAVVSEWPLAMCRTAGRSTTTITSTSSPGLTD